MGAEERKKFHTNLVKKETEQKRTKGLFSSLPSPFYKFCTGFHASVSVASTSVK